MSIEPSSQNLRSSITISSSNSSNSPNHGGGFIPISTSSVPRHHSPPGSMAAQIDYAPSSSSSSSSSKKMNTAAAPTGKRFHQKLGPNLHTNAHAPPGPSATSHHAARKPHVANANHLLNFQYDPVSRPHPRPPPFKRLPKRKPYNKDLFLQANYKFVLLDTGHCSPESIDPDKALKWEDIICVKYFTTQPASCPICLEDLFCPQMTSCGHIFCFPCILRYFLTGEDDHSVECWKKCPLCFMMISSKDLYTIYIENVKQHCVGDTVEFMLLTRQKDSLTLYAKSKKPFSKEEEANDSFSKFIFTSDADLSIREAMSELDSWLAKADSGLVDDLEKLPYVCAAMEQLEERKKYWNVHRDSYASNSCKHDTCHGSSPPNSARANGAFFSGELSAGVSDDAISLNGLKLNRTGEGSLHKSGDDVVESFDSQEIVSSSMYDDSKVPQIHGNGSRDVMNKDSYNFYQAADGQHLIIHPLNMKCLLYHYGSYDRLPERISGKILQLETVTQSEATRRRYPYLSHFSLTTTFQLAEIDLGGILPPIALSPFEDEIKNRETQRKRTARKEQLMKTKAEAAATAQYMAAAVMPAESYDHFPAFSMDDFAALGSQAATSSSPTTTGERPLFSSVARLGFAAGCDSPALRTEEAQILPKADLPTDSSGFQSTGTTSFASVISRVKPVEPKINESGKKGKKSNRVLLSTAAGRRY